MPLIRKDTESVSRASVDSAKVLTALVNGSDEERWAAARAAPDVPGGMKALGEALLRERSPRVREAVLTSLSRVSTAESVELLLPLLRSEEAHLRTGALDALRAMKGVVFAYLPHLLHDTDPDVRLLACELARNLPSEESARLLCELLESEPEPNVCASAVEVLAEVGGEEALPVLARCEERFRGISFLEFAIKITADRIRSPSPRQRA
jgi:HEAT repeat protein